MRNTNTQEVLRGKSINSANRITLLPSNRYLRQAKNGIKPLRLVPRENLVTDNSDSEASSYAVRTLSSKIELAQKFLLLKAHVKSSSSQQLLRLAQWWQRLVPESESFGDFKNAYERRIEPFLITTYQYEHRE